MTVSNPLWITHVMQVPHVWDSFLCDDSHSAGIVKKKKKKEKKKCRFVCFNYGHVYIVNITNSAVITESYIGTVALSGRSTVPLKFVNETLIVSYNFLLYSYFLVL